MAVYTIELRHLLKTGFDIGLQNYPIPNFANQTWRQNLNNKIVKHYYYREICDVPERFAHYLNCTMEEIMPKFNLLYEALNTKFSYDSGSTITETYQHSKNEKENLERGLEQNGYVTGNSESNSDGSGEGEGYSLQVNSTTPGQMLNVENDIENNTYASSATKNKNNSKSKNTSNATSHSESTGQNTEMEKHNNERGEASNYTKIQTGLFNKSNAQLFAEYAEAVRNLDMEVVESLKYCFMGIY